MKAAGVQGHLSSDGRMLEIVDDLVEIGVAMHDPQLRANTLDGIEKHYKGRMCIKLDLGKAFDSLNRNFICKALLCFGFDSKWVSWMHEPLVLTAYQWGVHAFLHFLQWCSTR